MIHKNDEITRRFYQVDKLLLENPKYEKLSDGAILTWSILRDRMELSKKNSEVYSDEEGYLFLIFTDEELGEIIHRNRKTANSRKKELEKFGLLHNVRMGNQEPNRLYLLEPEKCDPEEYISNRYRQKKKVELIEKQIKKAKNQKKKYVMIELSEDVDESCPQSKSLEGVMMGKKRTSVKSKKRTSGCPKNGHPDVRKMGCNDTELNDIDLNDTENFEEEEKIMLHDKKTEINIHFLHLIKEVLSSENIYDDKMIARIILEMKKNEISFLTKKEMLDQHRKMMKKKNSGEDIWSWAKYFVGGILENRLSESTALLQNRLSESEKFNEYIEQLDNQSNRKIIPFYNWLES
jgi:hypothetical protein